MKKRDTGCLLSGLTFPFKSKVNNTGTRNIATKAEPIMAKVFVQTKGANSLCSCPSKNKIGLKDISVMSIELKTAFPTNLEDASILFSLSSFVIITFILRLLISLRFQPLLCLRRPGHQQPVRRLPVTLYLK